MVTRCMSDSDGLSFEDLFAVPGDVWLSRLWCAGAALQLLAVRVVDRLSGCGSGGVGLVLTGTVPM
jgi:hypothetical protein